MKTRNSYVEIEKPLIYILTHYNTKPSLEGRFFNAATIIPNEDEIYEEYKDEDDTKKGRNRIIRFVPGEKSIYADEQSKEAGKKRVELVFVNGMMTVDRREVLKIEFLNRTNMNIGNPFRLSYKKAKFKLWKPEARAKEKMESQRALFEAKRILFESTITELARYAKVLKIDTRRTADEIRWDLNVKAEIDPASFVKGFKSKAMQKAFVIMDAIDKGILVHDLHDYSISWSSGGTIITSPPGTDTVATLVDYCYSSSGKVVFDRINDILSGGPQDSSPQDSSPQDSSPQDSSPQDSSPQDSGPQDSGPQDTRKSQKDEQLPVVVSASKEEEIHVPDSKPDLAFQVEEGEDENLRKIINRAFSKDLLWADKRGMVRSHLFPGVLCKENDIFDVVKRKPELLKNIKEEIVRSPI